MKDVGLVFNRHRDRFHWFGVTLFFIWFYAATWDSNVGGRLLINAAVLLVAELSYQISSAKIANSVLPSPAVFGGSGLI